MAGEEGRRWEGAPELCGEQRAKSEMDGLTDVCLRMQRRARGSGAGGSPQAQPSERASEDRSGLVRAVPCWCCSERN